MRAILHRRSCRRLLCPLLCRWPCDQCQTKHFVADTVADADADDVDVAVVCLNTAPDADAY